MIQLFEQFPAEGRNPADSTHDFSHVRGFCDQVC